MMNGRGGGYTMAGGSVLRKVTQVINVLLMDRTFDTG